MQTTSQMDAPQNAGAQAEAATLTQQIRPALILLALMTLLTGALYPALVTGLAQVVFPGQANGSLIEDGDTVVGSELIGQNFTNPAYFWGRISATGYDGALSSGSNLGPTNPALFEMIQARIDALRAADPENDAPIPVDLVTASASGLDPHISPAAAEYQVGRVAAARGVSEEEVRALVEEYTEARLLGFLAEPRVNVLRLNLALNEAFGRPGTE